MQIIKSYGTMWARNTDNINRIPRSREGIYILFDGSMPVYVGKRNIQARIRDARRSKRRNQLWDRFSWYAVADPKMMLDVEVLALRMLPRYLRALTRQDRHFLSATRVKQENPMADAITRKP
jgi:hypothetical protein